MKKILLLLYCCLYLFPAQAQDVNPNGGDILQESTQPTDSDPPAIANGQVVDITNAPWQVSLQLLIRGSFMIEQDGGGSILNPLWILTAAHVVINNPVSDWRVSAGSNNSFHTLNNVPVDGQLVQVAQIIIHPGYNPVTEENDLALVRLQTPLQFSNRVQPIQYATELNIPDNLMAPGAMVSLTGWGTTSYNSRQANPVLLGVNMPIISKVAANQIMQQQWQTQTLPRLVTDDMIAVYLAGSGKGVGYGDSGGPMVVLNNGVPTLIGVCAWLAGYGPAPYTSPVLGQSPSVYMRVKSYASWIQDNMAPNSWSFLQPSFGPGSVNSGVGMFRLKARHSGQALEIGGGPSATNAGATANQSLYAGGSNQKWWIFSAEDGYANLLASHSLMSLDVVGASQNAGALVNQWYGNSGATNQHWKIESIGEGYYKLLARHSGQALEIAGGPATTNAGATADQSPYVGGSNQQWSVEDIGVYGILPEYSSGGSSQTIQNLPCIGVDNVGSSDIINQQFVYPSTGGRVQWQIASTGGGAYKLVSQYNDQCLEIGGGNVQDGASANTWPYFGHPWQQWQLEVVGNGLWGNLYRLVAQHSGRVLTVSGAGNNLIVTQQPYNGSANQRFFIIGAGPQSAHRVASNAGVLSNSTQRSDSRMLSLFPNPANTQITLTLSSGEKPHTMAITDLRGAMMNTPYSHDSGQVDLQNLAPGLYLLTASDGKHEYHQKFMKE